MEVGRNAITWCRLASPVAATLHITEGPNFESPRTKRVRKDQRRTFKGKGYVVPNLDYWQCPDCGEQVYDHDAMRKIEAHSPAYAKRRAPQRRTAAR